MEKQTDFIPDGMNAFERNVKRIVDCLLALIAMIIFSPLFLICYIAVKREDGGPAIFKQERIGYGGRPFTIYKFRSMSTSSEEDGTPVLCQKDDDRLTQAVSQAAKTMNIRLLDHVIVTDGSYYSYTDEGRL